MQRITKLKLKNFKFFLGEETIDFEGKNLLIYGENGSGKSSIYWALYTFLQSVFKKDLLEIQKYFDRARPDNLVNIFAETSAESSIVIEFKADDQTITTKELSFAVQNTHAGNLVKETNQSSDFINYRLLSRLYDFSNSKQIDLFSIFEREILSFITLKIEFEPGNNNAKDWWDHLKSGPQPRPNMNTVEYREFQHKVGQFNNALASYLQDISQGTNEYLQQDFKQPLKIKLKYVPVVYNDFVDGSTTKRNHITIAPKIILSVEFLHEKLQKKLEELMRPQTFLNEAKLTAIALAIRLAILDQKFIATSPKLLVLDDLLISLDMSNRDLVLDLILNKYHAYQLLIMTHDLSFFNLIKRRIESSKNSSQWVVKELFHSLTKDGLPKPFIPQNSDYLDRAKKYLYEFDYPASANYLRKEAERILRRLLPTNRTVKLSKEEGLVELQLDTLIENFKRMYEEMGGDFSPFQKLKEYKDFLLNPLSHDNLNTSSYRIELESSLEIMYLLRNLDVKTLASVDLNKVPLIYLEESDSNNDVWIYYIELLENFRALKLLGGKWALSNPRCLFKKRENLTKKIGNGLNIDIRLFKGYDQVRHALNIKGSPPNDLLNIVKDSAGVYMKDLL